MSPLTSPTGCSDSVIRPSTRRPAASTTPLLATMLLGRCAGKLARAIRQRSLSTGLGPDALFPLRLREWASGALFAVESLLGFGLILTSGRLLSGTSAELIRLGTGVFFLVATCALIEIRSIRPAAGCGCFGDLS